MKKDGRMYDPEHPFLEALKSVEGCQLAIGKHEANGCACVLECASLAPLVASGELHDPAARARVWTDDPERTLGVDIRPLNDAYDDSEARTRDMIALAMALWDYKEWPEARKLAFGEKAAMYAVNVSAARMLRARALIWSIRGTNPNGDFQEIRLRRLGGCACCAGSCRCCACTNHICERSW
jgi:hypothetical protein